MTRTVFGGVAAVACAVVHGALTPSIATAQSAQSLIPPSWHQPPTKQELAYAHGVTDALRRAPDYPHVARYHLLPNQPPTRQINAWERNMEITVPVEMFRLIERDRTMVAFLIAHEAGHAKQEEIYGGSCSSTTNFEMSKFDWFRALGDVAGGAITNGVDGAARATAILQKQACEDNADAWAVKFMRQAGLDPTGGIRLFTKMAELVKHDGWRYFTQQFTSDHSLSELRIAHIAALIARQ